MGGQIWRLSQDPHGCREVQEALETVGDKIHETLAFELRGHVWEALRNPHANFVLQKFATLLSPPALQFVVDELVQGSACKAAKHKFGCRIVQRIVEGCTAEQQAQFVRPWASDFQELSQHPYGNYVIQHVLENAALEHRRFFAGLVERNLRRLAVDPIGSAVVSSALSKAPAACQVSLAKALSQQPDLLILLACTRFGCPAAARVLQLLHGEELQEVKQAFLAEQRTLRASKFGRLVLQHV